MRGSILGAILFALLSLTPAWARSNGRVHFKTRTAKPHFAVSRAKGRPR